MTNQSTLVDYLDGYADEARRLTGGSSQLSLAGIQTALESVTPGGADHTAEDGILNGSISGAYTNDRITSLRLNAIAYADATSVSFPNVTTSNSNPIGGCPNLVSASFPKLATINGSLCGTCLSLKSLYLPKLTALTGNNFFYNSSSLECVIFYSPDRTAVPTASSANVFTNSTIVPGGIGFVYINDDLVESMKVATNWASRSQQIKPISQCPQVYLDLYHIVLPTS